MIIEEPTLLPSCVSVLIKALKFLSIQLEDGEKERGFFGEIL